VQFPIIFNFWHGLCVFLSHNFFILKKKLWWYIVLTLGCERTGGPRLWVVTCNSPAGRNLKLPSPNFSVYFSKSGTPGTACQLSLLYFERYSSDFSFLSLLFFSTAFYKYYAYGTKPPERKQEKPALFFKYVKGLKIDPSGFSTCRLGLPGRDLKSRRVYFQTLLLSIRWDQIHSTKT
jgi:hypothetical protein